MRVIVPPSIEPFEGKIDEIDTSETKVKTNDLLLSSSNPPFVTEKGTGPGRCLGVKQRISEDDTYSTSVITNVPNTQAISALLRNPSPVTLIQPPPADAPDLGSSADTIGSSIVSGMTGGAS